MSDHEMATIVVLRTTDAKKVKIEMNMSESLNGLKDNISAHNDLGPLPRAHQRIFHLGRELKTGGRSLATLGVGRFKVFTVHLLAKGGAGAQQQQQNNKNDEVVEVVGRKRQRQRAAPAAAAAPNGRVVRRSNARSQPAAAAQQQQIHIEILSDSDDDEDLVEIVEAPGASVRRRNR